MEKFIYTNRLGRSITIAYQGSYIIADYSGLSESDVIPITSRGFRQIGQTLAYTSLGTRIIGLNFFVHAMSMADFYEKRRNLSSLFNPLLGEGTLIYSNDFITKQISVLPTMSPEPKEKMGTLQRFYVEFLANDPFWYDITESKLLMTGFTGGLTYPLESEDYQFADIAATAKIINNGDWLTPVRFKFVGAMTNPKITNTTTGEFIEVTKTLVAGEQLIIDTAYGNKTVTYVDGTGASSSAYNLITNTSSFLQLQVGENRLTFVADTGIPEIFIVWRNRFVGV